MEEYAPEIIYMKGIHNTVADAILQLEYNPKLYSTNDYTHAMLGDLRSSVHNNENWSCTTGEATKNNASTEAHCIHMNKLFANHSEEDKIYPLTTAENAEA